MSEEKKFTLEEVESMLNEESGSGGLGGLNFQTIFAALVLYWHWFLLSLIIFLCGALIYLRYTEPVYSVSARMLIKDENSKRRNANQMLSNMEDFGFLTNSTGIDNEMEILQSSLLMRDVVKDLKVYTEYRSVGRVINSILYGSQPLNVDLAPVHLDSLDINLLTGVRSIKMKLSRQGGNYVVQGSLWLNKQEQKPFIPAVSSRCPPVSPPITAR